MARLTAFNQISLDGYFTDVRGDMSWAHKPHHDAEWQEFVAANAQGGGRLVFGRVTYEMMASYWPTPMAKANDPIVAERMNQLPKIVFSRTLTQASWSNTRLIGGNLAAEIRAIKQEPGDDMAILGSGSIVAQLAGEGLIDEYQLVINPIVLGGGRTLFEGVEHKLSLRLARLAYVSQRQRAGLLRADLTSGIMEPTAYQFEGLDASPDEIRQCHRRSPRCRPAEAIPAATIPSASSPRQSTASCGRG